MKSLSQYIQEHLSEDLLDLACRKPKEEDEKIRPSEEADGLTSFK